MQTKKYSNKEIVTAVFERENLHMIPKAMVAIGYMIAKSGRPPAELMSSPDIYAEMCVQFAEDYEMCLNPVGFFKDIVATMGGGLINRDGKVSEDGCETLLTPDLIEALNNYDCAKSRNLEDIANKIKAMKQRDSDTPTFAIVNNQCMIASELIGAGLYYRKVVKQPEFVKEVQQKVENPLFEGLERLAEAGLDIVWVPMPTMGGTCIRKETYVNVHHEYSKRMVEHCHNLGIKVIIHTCGKWNDRFDVVIDEKPDMLHLSQTNIADFHHNWGSKVSMMGNISVVETLMQKTPDEVYNEAFAMCIDAASDGTYVIAPDCGMDGSIPEENVRAMYRAADDANKELFG